MVVYGERYNADIIGCIGSRCLYGAGGGVIAYASYLLFGYDILRVDGRSMQPTFNPHLGNTKRHEAAARNGSGVSDFCKSFLRRLTPENDWVLISSNDRYNLNSGDIVTLYNPTVPMDQDIKRVKATGLQVVTSNGYKNRRVVVPEGHIWVEGDNTAHSNDSNTYGPIPAGLVFGKAVAIVFPPRRWKWFKRNG